MAGFDSTRDTQVIGVILSGILNDGVAGLSAIKTCGGITMVQDPENALHPEMPLNALKNVKVDYSLPVAQLSSRLLNLMQKCDTRISLAESAKRTTKALNSNLEIDL